jgi:hypothetical protein
VLQVIPVKVDDPAEDFIILWDQGEYIPDLHTYEEFETKMNRDGYNVELIDEEDEGLIYLLTHTSTGKEKWVVVFIVAERIKGTQYDKWN